MTITRDAESVILERLLQLGDEWIANGYVPVGHRSEWITLRVELGRLRTEFNTSLFPAAQRKEGT